MNTDIISIMIRYSDSRGGSSRRCSGNNKRSHRGERKTLKKQTGSNQDDEDRSKTLTRQRLQRR